jgi:hypothetical protein
MTSTPSTGTFLKWLIMNPSKVKLVIHHQCPDIELVSPLYYSEGATCYLPPDQRIDAGSTMKAGFNIGLLQVGALGALIYKLQRKNIDQFNEDGTFSEEESTCIQFVMVWGVQRSGEFYVDTSLMEHDKDVVWYENKLMCIVKKYVLRSIDYGPVEYTWLISDNMVLTTRMNVPREAKCYKLEVTISKGSINEYTQEPSYLNLVT